MATNWSPDHPPPWRRLAPLALAAAAVVAAVALTVLIGAWLFNPPARDLLLLALYLALSGGGSLVLAYLGLALAGRLAVGGLQLKMVLTPLLAHAIAVAFANVVTTALLMFISEHDLGLLTILLCFSGLLSLFYAYLLAAPITLAVRTLARAAAQVSGGDLRVAVPVTSRDELGQLAEVFNRMAAQLAEASARQRALEQARRDMIAAVSHDLRTPLASVRAMVEAIDDGVVTDEAEIHRYLRNVQAQVDRLTALIDDLFELSQIDAGAIRLQLERVRLIELFRELVDGMRPQAERKGVRLGYDPVESLSPVQADPQRIHRVLLNLVQNAIRHTPADGTVWLSAHDAGNALEVKVRDTGEGIESEDLPHVFERFYRGEKSRSRDFGGAGLGLAICKGLIEAHGGALWVESQRGVGSVFRFTLPKAS